MVDTAIFSIFHRAATPSAPPPPELVEAAATHPIAPIVEHPLLSNPSPVRPEEPTPEPSKPAEPASPHAEIPEPTAPEPEPVEAVDDHPEIPRDTGGPVHHEPVVGPALAPEASPHEPHAVEQPSTYEAAMAEIAEIVHGPEPKEDVQPEPFPEPEPIHEPVAEHSVAAEEEPAVEFVQHAPYFEDPPLPLEARFDPPIDDEPVHEPAGLHHEPDVGPSYEPEASLHEPHAAEQAPIHAAEIAPTPEIVRSPEPEAELPPEPAPHLFQEPEPEPIAEPVPEADMEPAARFVPDELYLEDPPLPLEADLDPFIDAEPASELTEPYHEPLESIPDEPLPAHWTDHLPQDGEPDAAPHWHGPAELADIPVDADQLGLANPVVITLVARLEDSSSVELDASQSGIYRPQTFRAAPWSGFAYDQATDGRTGLAAGTRILTSRGEMEVERLLPGDAAMTLRAPALIPIAWIGKSVATAAPIWIDAGALGPNLPRRALCLAPDQPVYVEPIPVPASRLVNGTTIRVVESEDLDLFHVDVGRSEILFAEGVPLSSGDRTRVQRA